MNIKLIKIIGVGGAGSTIAGLCKDEAFDNAEIIAVDADKTDIIAAKVDKRILFSKQKDLKGILAGSELVFICSCLGGKTSADIVPLIAEEAQKLKLTTIPIMTLPFKMEGDEKRKIAEQALQRLRQVADEVIVIDYNMLLTTPDMSKLNLHDALSAVNRMIADTIKGIIQTVFKPSLVNLDALDLKKLISHKGIGTIFSTALSEKAKAMAAVEKITSHLLCPLKTRDICGCIIAIFCGPDINLDDISKIGEAVVENLDDKADVMWGAFVKDELKGKMNVNVVFVGKEKQKRKRR